MATVQAASRLIVFCIAFFFLSSFSEASTGFNTVDLVRHSIKPKCLDWKIIGLCFWLKCSPKCKIRTTLKISHYLPDYTVTTSPDQCPWQEIALLSKITFGNASKNAGGNPGRGGSIGKYAMKFKESMVVGNPAAQVGHLFNTRFLCKTQSKPMYIYFNSRHSSNAQVWRGIGLGKAQNLVATDTDRVETWTPGNRIVGRSEAVAERVGPELATLYDGWGSIYPRRGTILQADDVKAGAVVSQRAIEIVVRNKEGYAAVVQADTHDEERQESWGSIRNTQTQCRALGGQWHGSDQIGKCLVPSSVQQRPKGMETSDQWQMVYPKVESQCAPFDARAGLEPDWSVGRVSKEGAYGYNFWQRYKCCMPRSGIYLFSIEF